MKELQVHYHGLGEPFLVGTLAEDSKDVLFQYSGQALARGVELSPIRLPLRPVAYPERQSDYAKLHAVPGLIYDSLPDGWGFRLMHRRMRSRGINQERVTTLDRLAYLSANTMGALTYVPAMADIQDTRDLTLLELAQEVQAVLTDEGHQVLAELARAGVSPGGARPKANVFFNPTTGQMSTQAGLVPDAEAWLVKFPGDDDEPDSCALEELYALMAHACDLGMTATRHFKLTNGLTAFATARFDRRGAQRVHVHSLAGLLHANFQEPSVSYEDFFRATRRLTRDQRQLKMAVQRCVFNVLMNNRDDHSKNLSFMMEAGLPRGALHGCGRRRSSSNTSTRSQSSTSRRAAAQCGRRRHRRNTCCSSPYRAAGEGRRAGTAQTYGEEGPSSPASQLRTAFLT
jgi:serine/threonine-protein kinase HipA